MKNEKNLKNYYVGLDIGTNSIGYAVTDENYKLFKFKGEPMWGTHIFEEAHLSQERRTFRSARRRLDRRQQRVQLVGELFAKEICEIDPNFFKRLQFSYLHPTSEEDKFRLFDDMEMHKAYCKKYPTIHHLIKALMNDEKAHDVREVYIACAWLVAHRGHFLSDISKEHIDEVKDFSKVYNEFVSFMQEAGDSLNWEDYAKVIEEVMPQKKTITGKKDLLVKSIFIDGKAPKTIDEAHPYNIDLLLKMLAGSKVELKDLFGKEEYAELENKSIALSADDGVMSQVLSDLNEDAELIIKLKAIFDWSLLINVLNGSESISEAKVKVYKQHDKDLDTLKYFVKKYFYNERKKILRDDNGAYYKSYVTSKINKEVFNDNLKKLFKDLVVEAEDEKAFAEMMERLEIKSFMPKQVDGDNRVIPYQLYWSEMEKLLTKAQAYLPFIASKDEDDISVKDKLLSIMEYRIPYYVGPLNKSSKFAWVERKAGKIYPWNFDKMVDLDKSEQAFIEKMTNTCSYLAGAPVLPKNSLCYTAYEVLNEINNVKINDVPISVECKQGIYNELFLKYPKVTVKKIKDYLMSNGYMKATDELSGIDVTIKSSLKSYHAFKRLLNAKTLNEKQVEEIISRATYSEDKNRYRKWLRKEFSFLNEEDVKYIANLKFKEFGRISKQLLTDTLGADLESGTGEAFSIMEMLWNTNCNLMQILSARFTFKDAIESYNEEYYKDKKLTLNEKLDDLWVSNAVKRPIMRTLDIMKDVTKVMGCAPKRIFVEVTRGGEEKAKKKRTKSRYEQIREFYKTIKGEDVRELNAQLDAMGDNADNMLQSDVLFLYYLQMGKCLYTGMPIDVTKLKDGTFNTEHIYPRSLVKDDSIINNKCLVLSEINGQKSDQYPINPEIQEKMYGYWKYLNSITIDGAKLLSDEKLKRLTRKTPFTESEKMGFIQRQLVETSQSTKAIATLFKDMYPNTEVVYVKAGLVSDFRHEVINMHKSRLVNDLHHAKDAYLNIAVGNVYHNKFSKKFFRMENEYSLKPTTIFTHNVYTGKELIWNLNSLEQVKKTMLKNNIHFTVYQFVRKGGFFDQNPVKKGSGLTPLKKDKPTEIYGGYNKATASYFVLAKYQVGKKKEITIIPVTLLASKRFETDLDYRLAYVREYLIGMSQKNAKAENVEILFDARPMKINTLLSLDGLRMSIAGKSDDKIIVNNMSAVKFENTTEDYIKKLEAYIQKKEKNKNIKLDEKYDGITSQKNNELYQIYIEKLKNSLFKNRPNTPIELLENSRNKFETLDLNSQIDCLLQIQLLFGRGGTTNLEKIGGSKTMGKTRCSANLSNWKKSYKDVRIIDTSASGLFESVSENLLNLI